MSYILVVPAMLSLVALGYYFFLRKPVLESSRAQESVAMQAFPHATERNAFSEWEQVISRALVHIYSGTPATSEEQLTHVYGEPPALAVAAMSDMVRAFDKVGTMHSSLAALDVPDISMKALGDIVTRDPLLSARVLKTVNSPFFRTAMDVKSVHTAVNILGLVNLKNLVAFGVLPYDLYKHAEHRRMFRDIWQHMNATAITAAHMARTRQDLDSGTLYTAGLMHDIGKLVLILLMKGIEEDEPYPTNLNREYERLTATHLQAARVMARSGGIPAQLQSLVLNHHLPALLPAQHLDCDAEHARYLTVLFLADQVAKLITPEGSLMDDVTHLDRLDPSYREILSKAEAREILLCPGLIDDILANVRVVQASLN